MTDATARVELATTRDGTAQLRRRWQVADPRAAVAMVHGYGEHSGRYLHVGAFLSERGLDVEAHDNRGFGESGGRRGHVDSFEVFLEDIEDRLAQRRRLGVPVVLFGHSLGGLMVTTYLTSGRPQPDLAVLSAPALAARLPRWQRVAAPVLGRILPRVFIPAEIDGDALSRDEALQAAYAADPLRVGGATARLGHQTFRTMRATMARIDRIEVPTYVFHGDADVLVPQAATRPLEALDQVTYRSWPNLRHECLNEPEQVEVMTEMVAWVDRELARDR